ncbi:hypothetical protein [Citrobacter phage CVT22]|uniref:Uncharacterized protein n=1 Tax=Citrobacter phage CVT22 TaxID=1622234 RepID=A0A0R6CHM6_9CAUD|nr:hypothetical protein APL39_gp64 [Citrobacter phage CVT22]AJT60768.1 hypothetical protein [Citrobacter phage CVT22]
MSKFKAGDLVSGTPEASEAYSITASGGIYEVKWVEDRRIGIKIIEDSPHAEVKGTDTIYGVYSEYFTNCSLSLENE